MTEIRKTRLNKLDISEELNIRFDDVETLVNAAKMHVLDAPVNTWSRADLNKALQQPKIKGLLLVLRARAFGVNS